MGKPSDSATGFMYRPASDIIHVKFVKWIKFNHNSTMTTYTNGYIKNLQRSESMTFSGIEKEESDGK